MNKQTERLAGERLRKRFYLAYLLILPPAAVWILYEQGWRVSAWIAIFAAIAIFMTIYLRAALFATLSEDGGDEKGEWLRTGGVIALVGISALFDWRRWIAEQLLLEVAAFSAAIALIALRKAASEGGLVKGPWMMVLVMFVLPAAGLIAICVKALLHSAGDSWSYPMALPLLLAFGIAAFDAARKLGPYTLGNKQLSEPVEGGVALVLLVIWFVALLIGMPLLLSGKAGG
ncbi:MAG: hypothetical protein P1U68_17340 [Verrucomicrobiales bacterium]|nr:hypothetical protein [Verrucomicrobiales bacterium]